MSRSKLCATTGICAERFSRGGLLRRTPQWHMFLSVRAGTTIAMPVYSMTRDV